MTTKLCIDCIHCRVEEIGSFTFHKCVRNDGINLATGQPEKARYEYCDDERTDGWLSALIFGTCGKRGRFWEPKLDEPVRRIDDSIDEYAA